MPASPSPVMSFRMSSEDAANADAIAAALPRPGLRPPTFTDTIRTALRVAAHVARHGALAEVEAEARRAA